MLSIFKEKKIAKTTEIILISFLALIIIGGILLSLPFSNLPGKPISLLNSFFTATASVCVAGLGIVAPIEQFSLFGKIVMLCLIQIGAMGFIFVLSSFILLTKKKLSFKDKINIGTVLGTPEKLNQSKTLIRRIMAFSAISEICGAIILSIRFIPMFGFLEGIGQSLFTSVSSFCNCGFDLLGNNSLIDYSLDYLVLGVCAIQTILGSLGFIVWNELYEVLKKKHTHKLTTRKTWLTLSTHCKIVLTMLLVMIIIGTCGYLIFEHNNPLTLGKYKIADKIFVSMFQGISARTTGMTAIDLGSLTNSGKFFTIIMMLIGGNPGSTAGGIKTVTIAVLIITMLSSVSNNKSVNVFRREVSNDNIKKSVTVLVSALIIVSITTMTLLTLNPTVSFIDMLFEVSSALATCGFSTGITASLTFASKVILILIMFVGRVSTVTMTMAMVGDRFKQKAIVNYPVDNVNIG